MTDEPPIRRKPKRRRPEAMFRAVLEAAPDAIVTVDGDGRIVLVNAQTERLFGYGRQELLGQCVELLVPERYRSAHVGHRAQYLREPRFRPMGAGLDFFGLRKDGSEFPAQISLSFLQAEDGLLVTSSIRDVTVYNRMQQALLETEGQLRQSQRMEAIGLIAGGIAHDFNNLLTAIIGFSELLLADLPPDQPLLRTYVEGIADAGQRAGRFTRQILAFGRQQVLQPQIFDLNTVVADLAILLRRVIEENIEIAFVQEPDLGNIRADRGQIEQIIMNLAINAREAMPMGGKLSIETANVDLVESHISTQGTIPPGQYVVLEVKDTGVGMERDIQARIFEPFFTTKEPGQGTGLGLATAYGAVKESGGQMVVESEPGRGTTFTIYFPPDETAPEPPEPGPATFPVNSGSETLLLAEDDPGVRALARTTLAAKGYRVLEAIQAEEALQVCQHHAGPIHLLLTDVVMPGMSGRALAERMLALRPEAKVLYMSGYATDLAVRRGMREADVAYLQKPFAPIALARKVREVLDSPKETERANEP